MKTSYSVDRIFSKMQTVKKEKHMSIRFAVALGVLAASLVFPGTALAKDDSLQIKGSDTMVNLVQAWAEEFMTRKPGSFAAVTGGGSGTGFASLISGTCDIAMSSREIKAKEIALAQKKGIDPKEYKPALDGLAVVVHKDNPVHKLTLEQLADIFSGKISNWKELGGPDLHIVVLSREVNSGTHVYFKEHVLRKNDSTSKVEFAPDALLMPSSQAIADEAASNTGSIGYFGMGYANPSLRIIAVSKDAASESVVPTIETVVSGAYPISRPLFIYTNGEPQGAVKEFIDFALSPEGQEIVKKTDFVPIKTA